MFKGKFEFGIKVKNETMMGRVKISNNRDGVDKVLLETLVSSQETIPIVINIVIQIFKGHIHTSTQIGEKTVNW